LAVHTSEGFADEDFVSEVLAANIIEEVKELIIIVVKQGEAQTIFQVRGKLLVEIVISLKRLHHSNSVTVLNEVYGVIVDVVVELGVGVTRSIYRLEVHLDVILLLIDNFLKSRELKEVASNA